MAPNTVFNSDAQVGFEAGKEVGEGSFRKGEIEGVPFTLIGTGYSLALRPELLERPKRRTGTIAVADIDGFCRLFNKFKSLYGDEPLIFVDSDPQGKRPATFKAVMNYHGEKPDHGDFAIVHTAQFSVEWNRWMAKNSQGMGHAAFVEHLEDVSDLIKQPLGADLLKLIQSLEGTVKARFENALNLHNGSMKLTYNEDVDIRGVDQTAQRPGEMVVPAEITCAVAPFEFGDAYAMKNRVRYRVNQKQLSFSYEAIDPHLIIQDAVKGQISKIHAATESQPYQGKI